MVNSGDHTGISFIDTPSRHVAIVLERGGHTLSCDVDASGLPDMEWTNLKENGLPPVCDGSSTGVESSLTNHFQDRIATTLSTLGNALDLLVRSEAIGNKDVTFLEFARQLVEEERRETPASSRSEKYRVASARFASFLSSIGKEGLLLSNLNQPVISAFNTELLNEGLKPSTCAFYNRILQSIYRQGVKRGLAVDIKPFSGVATQFTAPAQSTPQTSISDKEITRLRAANLSDNPELAETRDILLLSYYSNLSLGEIAALQRDADGSLSASLGEGRVVIPEVEQILRRYTAEGYIFFSTRRQRGTDEANVSSNNDLQRFRSLMNRNLNRLKWRLKLDHTPSISSVKRASRYRHRS